MEYPKFSFRRAPEIATRLEEEATNRELTTSELVREIVTTSALTALVALVVAVMLLLAYFFRLAFLADFLSRSDLIGLLTGIGVQVGELAGLLGIEKQGGGTLKQLTSRLGITVVGAVAGYNRTDDSEQRGGNSLLSTAAIVLLVLLFLTKPLSFPPSAVLSAILFMVGVKLIDAQGLGELYQPRRNEFFIALATATAPSRGAWNIRRSRCDRLPL